MDQARYDKGMKRLQQMNNMSTIGSRLMEISPELNRYIKEFAFGDVHSREGLSPRDHELVIISGLCALGFAAEEMRSHINMGLNAGLTRQEILETFIQLAVYAGFPAAVNATFIAKEIFDARDAKGIKN
ncbi:MAG: carboxymuconolactone decarboxylase family protein [Lentisphaeria bacterium]|nr:carboxymuconolactone decarboxylase family protein [Lentisphaeria bacterium]